MNRHCDNCYFSGKCQNDIVCDDYTPVCENSIDEETNDIIEENRIAFREEWFEYIESCNK